MKILLLEDDLNLHQSLKSFLEMDGFSVDSAYCSEDVYTLSYANSYDLYIFDINVPGDDGFKIVESLKAADDTTPTIYISALVDIGSIGEGFRSGADDYIKKPFDPEELVIRIRSRYCSSELLRYKNLSYNPENQELFMGEEVVGLSSVLRGIFHTLLLQRGKIVLNDTLLDFLEHPNPNALRVNISKLKTKLDLDIKNVRGIGYILE